MISVHTQAIRLDPNDASVFNNRGAAHNAAGNRDLAIADYTEAIRINPTAGRFYNRGLAYRDAGNLDAAIADWEAALRIDPNHAAARRSLESARQQRGR